ncbi:T9SS type A sorting domain-containing protein [Ulvibacter antarcticus]|uniref:Putative secreted protein (Por secretion system target) n=1 Tax=Ulvibacter antarcticus TaxID=442714 RepID=A0A3L9YE86_9FLAO|nr:T9SS type A sorting domain-containing protein [Ulvibacter antarcticus]RMA57760.1 putative secreted protein (Por secretion system target) [Ulvibacter antarcticus]
MKLKVLIAFAFLVCSSHLNSQNYKVLMEDNTVNFYEVVNEAEAYFNSMDKTAKGSGLKGFERWRAANEYKYYPSGRRDNVDPFFVEHSYQEFLSTNPTNNLNAAVSNWSELGPFTIDNISGHYSPGLGRVEDFYVNPANPNQLYLGSRSGGFWKSIDGGANWTGGSVDFLFASGVNTIAVAPSNPNTVLINIRNARNGYSHGIYKSIDGGNSWALSNFNPTNVGFGGLGDSFQIKKIFYHPTIANLIFIGTNEGLFRSDDNLATWTRILTAADISNIAFHPTDANTMYLTNEISGTRNTILISNNTGLNFSNSSTISGNSNATGYLSVSPSCVDCVYFASSNGVWKSTNKGASFTFLSNPASGCHGGFVVSDLDDQNILYGYVDTEISTDGGATFNQTSFWSLGNSAHGTGTNEQRFGSTTSYVHADLRNAKVVSGVFYVASDGFLCKSDDNGTTWDILSQGTAIRENYKLGASQSNHFRSISGSQDNGTSIKKENSWLEIYGADGMEGIFHPLNDDWAIGSVQYGGRIRTQDGGLTVGGVSPSGQSGGGNADWEAPFAYDPNNQMRVYNFSQSVYVSEDFGSTWTASGSPASFSGNIQDAAVAENNSNIIIISAGSFIDKSVNGGVSFASIKSNLPNGDIRDIAFDPNNDDVIIVVYASYENNGEKVYKTVNGGSSWTNITHNLGNMPVQSVVIDHTTDSNIYLGAEIGIYTMPMNDTNWTLYNTNLPNTTIEELEIVNGSNTLKAATWGRGLWEGSIVDRASYPKILTTKITDQPSDNKPFENIDQFVTSTISYTGTLSNVYVAWSEDSPSFGNVIPMTNTAGDIWISDTAIPNFPIGTRMYFKVFAEGGSGDISETYKFMYTVKAFSHCEATGNGSTTSDYINSVSLNGFVNNSGKDGYTYYDTTPIELAAGDSYELMIQMVTHFALDDAGAWIDYNKNGDFEASEAITMSAYNSSHQSFGTIAVPFDAVRDEVIVLRTRNSYFDAPQPCGSDAGEVEDYAIIIREPCFDKPTTSWDGIGWSNGPLAATKKAVFTSSYSTAAGSIDACSCDVENNATLTIAADNYLNVVGDISVESGSSIIVEHTANVVQIDDYATVANNGTINVNVTTPGLTARDFMILGSMMTSENETAFEDALPAYQVLNHTTSNFQPYVGTPPIVGVNFYDQEQNDWTNFSGTLNAAEGYLVRPSYTQSGSYNYTFDQGTLYNGKIVYVADYNTDKESSANILSNPYASAIDADMLITGNTMIDEVYFWEHNTTPGMGVPGPQSENFNMEDISTYNGTMGIPSSTGGDTPNGIIATAQGFGIKANAPGDVVFKNTMRLTSGNTNLRKNIDKDLIWLTVREGQYHLGSTTGIGFLENAGPQLDNGYDTQKLGTVVSLYTHLEDGSEQLGIQGREIFNDSITILMGFSTLIESDGGLPYVISISDIEGNAIEAATVYLIDHTENTITNLSEANYEFVAVAGTYNHRFTLQFVSRTLSTSDFDLADVLVFPNPAQNVLNIVSPNTVLTGIEIFDLRGRSVKTVAITSEATQRIDISNLQSALYLVKISSENGSITKRIVKY